ncbi:hypothetical protein BC938DRAFT_482733 [Jimgerdemannia flammicorona]|uniref:Uncharacterized protein n=1 Tax=Jimgerdemannia flammicorona TaxID=994334 RepID=A0A433QDA3_9FUNG|nr:hypothetical protein BC938DRAFT_482733 [Jimgerdemannia flammicorona]
MISKFQPINTRIIITIWYIIQSQYNINANTIYNYWRHIEILSVDFNANLQNFDKNIYQTITTNLILNNLTDILKVLHLQDPIIPNDNQIIIELISIFKPNIEENSDEKNINKIDSSSEVPLVSFTIFKNYLYIFTSRETDKFNETNYY